MADLMKYMPTFRGRQEELKVLTSFKFGHKIYPCVEILKEADNRRKVPRTFEQIYLPIIRKVSAPFVFIDLPVHYQETNQTSREILEFLLGTIRNRRKRTDYILKLSSLSKKIIPVISTYSIYSNEDNTIIKQEADLRKVFPIIGFRTFAISFMDDMKEIEKCIQPNDYLIVDLLNEEPQLLNSSFREVNEYLKRFEFCKKIILRSSINKNIVNNKLDHGKKVEEIDNNLINTFAAYNSDAFGDYAGIKKEDVTDGGGISPGFLYYDATENNFYGYKGRKNELSTFETIIVPDVLHSEATHRMNTSAFLSDDNFGWAILVEIYEQHESGKSQAKFKDIAMYHYLHCLKMKIEKGDFG